MPAVRAFSFSFLLLCLLPLCLLLLFALAVSNSTFPSSGSGYCWLVLFLPLTRFLLVVISKAHSCSSENSCELRFFIFLSQILLIFLSNVNSQSGRTSMSDLLLMTSSYTASVAAVDAECDDFQGVVICLPPLFRSPTKDFSTGLPLLILVSSFSSSFFPFSSLLRFLKPWMPHFVLLPLGWQSISRKFSSASPTHISSFFRLLCHHLSSNTRAFPIAFASPSSSVYSFASSCMISAILCFAPASSPSPSSSSSSSRMFTGTVSLLLCRQVLSRTFSHASFVHRNSTILIFIWKSMTESGSVAHCVTRRQRRNDDDDDDDDDDDRRRRRRRRRRKKKKKKKKQKTRRRRMSDYPHLDRILVLFLLTKANEDGREERNKRNMNEDICKTSRRKNRTEIWRRK